MSNRLIVQLANQKIKNGTFKKNNNNSISSNSSAFWLLTGHSLLIGMKCMHVKVHVETYQSRHEIKLHLFFLIFIFGTNRLIEIITPLCDMNTRLKLFFSYIRKENATVALLQERHSTEK